MWVRNPINDYRCGTDIHHPGCRKHDYHCSNH